MKALFPQDEPERLEARLVDQDRIWFKSHHGIEAQQVGREPGCARRRFLRRNILKPS
jgi:hypothetical protein